MQLKKITSVSNKNYMYSGKAGNLRHIIVYEEHRGGGGAIKTGSSSRSYRGHISIVLFA